MDPLSDVLSLLKPRSHVSAGFDAGGQWSIQFPDQQRHIKCYAVISGACWLTVQDVADPVRLSTGDCFVLPSGRPFRLASDLNLTPVDSGTIFPPARPGGVVTCNGGGDFFLVGSRFAISGDHAGMLMSMLPPIVHIRKEADQAPLRWAVERMMHELQEQKPGGVLVAQHLAHMMLIQALRLHLAEGDHGGPGWMSALADRQMGAAIGIMHDAPSHSWTLQTLAAHVGMSRTAFAQRFRETVGTTPMAYLTRWRMLLAGDRLKNTDDSISAIAAGLGYESESAFSTAFKRVMGCPPRQYGRARQEEAPATASAHGTGQTADML